MTDTRRPAPVPGWARHLPERMPPEAVDLGAHGSLASAWVEAWSDRSRETVLHHGGRWITADELEERSRRVAGRLHGAGLERGSRVVVSCAPSAEFVIAYAAAVRLGLVAVPVNGAYRQREVGHIVRDCRPRAAIVDDPERGGWIRDASVDDVVVVGPDVDLADADPPELDASGADDLVLVAYTSGTTGAPKGAMLSHGNALASARAVSLAWRWTAEDRLVLALPLFHMHGLGVGLHGTLLTGASAVLLDRFDADLVLDAAVRHGATLFFGVPTMYARLAASRRADELGVLRLCVSGSAPLPAALHEQIAAASGQRILERYGMTETFMNVSNPHDGERRPGTVGFPLPGVEVRIASGDACGVGEIELRGPNVFRGYWQRPEASAEAFTTDGWFRSGDLGRFDEDGYLRIEGRSKELIITGGYNVYPREVEDVLRSHPDVEDAAVVGVPSDEWGETVTAFVVADGVDAAALVEHAAAELARYKVPRAVHVVDELPRNALGKVLKQELRGRLTGP